MHLCALSMGYAIPDADFDTVIHSAFRSALNLRVKGESHLLTLVASAEGDLPQGICLDLPDHFSFENFRVGEFVICRDGLLRFKDDSLNVQLRGARRWMCDLPALKFDPAGPAVSAAWKFAWNSLNEQQRLAEAELVADELLHMPARTVVSRKAGGAMRELINNTQRYDANSSPVKTLVGLGSGLTPGGDDLLTGYLVGLWCTVHNESTRTRFVSKLGQEVIWLSSRTNDISRTYLYHAARGQVSSRLANLAVVICRGENPQVLNEMAEAAFHVGHTSGTDAVTGLLIGLAAWTDLI